MHLGAWKARREMELVSDVGAGPNSGFSVRVTGLLNFCVICLAPKPHCLSLLVIAFAEMFVSNSDCHACTRFITWTDLGRGQN